jgi:hypothetical protein
MKPTNATKAHLILLMVTPQRRSYDPLVVDLKVAFETFKNKFGAISTTQLEAPDVTKKLYAMMIELHI